mmetsp:Transcript_9098/g.14012  ORF Transcript_9098/g.14012 Transcript_9098/m.14012 type:complete len:207 (+) Transcript_9098:35-655(+)
MRFVLLLLSQSAICLKLPPINSEKAWRKIGEIGKFDTPWLTLYGEKLENNDAKILDYWRVERAHSCIAIVLHKNDLLLPQPMFRPGIQVSTIDFCGGRATFDDLPLTQIVSKIIQREMSISPSGIQSIKPLNPQQGWPVNSSFSNQLLFAFVCVLKEELNFSQQQANNIIKFPNTNSGHRALLDNLTCLQCRAVLLEYILQENKYI